MMERVKNTIGMNTKFKKEQIFTLKSQIYFFIERIRGKLQRIERQRIIQRAKNKLMNEQFSIVSQNCIGGVFYHDMEMEFLSPTINLYFEQPDFVLFVLNLKNIFL